MEHCMPVNMQAVVRDKNMLAHSQNRVVRISKISVKKSLQVVT